MKTIGIIGAQGKLGTKLSQKLEQLSEPKFRLLKTKDVLHNQDIARESDVLILTVPPEDVLEVLQEVKSDLQDGAEIVSLAAAVPSEAMQQIVDQQVSRAMIDPRFLIGMFMPNGSKETFFEGVVKDVPCYPLRYTKRDDEIDEFTVAMSYFFTVVTWAFAHRGFGWDTWLEPYLNLAGAKLQLSQAVVAEVIEVIQSGGDFENHLKTKATKGGVTEALIEALSQNEEAGANQLWEVGMERIGAVRELVA